MYMTAVPVTDLRPGDIITTDSDDITVTLVETIHYSPAGGSMNTDMVRIHGRITRGTGRGMKVRTWTKFVDQTVDVERP